ncbi:MAG: hypothetical protein ABMA25_08335 [Ilumatobacteraceae bacterium]
MTDTPTPEAPQPPTTSVVIDRNAQVAVSRRPMYVAIAAVVAFAAFTVVWFAARDEYEPGPAAKSFLSALADSGVAADPEDDELQCIDDSADGLDPSFFADGGLDVLGGEQVDEAQQAFAIKVLDECLNQPSRVALLASGMSEDGSLNSEQATCLAGKMDDAIVGNGGYASLIEMGDSSEAAGELVSVIFSSMATCNIDFGQMTGGDSEED